MNEINEIDTSLNVGETYELWFTKHAASPRGIYLDDFVVLSCGLARRIRDNQTFRVGVTVHSNVEDAVAKADHMRLKQIQYAEAQIASLQAKIEHLRSIECIDRVSLKRFDSSETEE